MNVLKMVVAILVLGLSGCETTRSPLPFVETSRGEQPVVCYVYARGRRILVPISCAEASLIK